MLDYNQINKLFGAPLNTVPQPNVPFKMTTTYWIIGGVVVFIFGLGVKVLIDELTGAVKVTKVKPKEESPKVKIPNYSNVETNEDENRSFDSNHETTRNDDETLAESIQNKFRSEDYSDKTE